MTTFHHFLFFPLVPAAGPVGRGGRSKRMGHTCALQVRPFFLSSPSFFPSALPSFAYRPVGTYRCSCSCVHATKNPCASPIASAVALSLSLSLSLLPLNVSPISVISGSQDSRSCETPLAA